MKVEEEADAEGLEQPNPNSSSLLCRVYLVMTLRCIEMISMVSRPVEWSGSHVDSVIVVRKFIVMMLTL